MLQYFNEMKHIFIDGSMYDMNHWISIESTQKMIKPTN